MSRTGGLKRKRRKARDAKLREQAEGVRADESGAPAGGDGEMLAADTQQGTSEAANSTNPPEYSGDSPWWQELSEENVARLEAAGQGEAVKRMREIRMEVSAVKNGNPISNDLRARYIWELAKAATSTKSSQREKIIAAKSLASIDIAYKRRDLPEQIHLHQYGESATPMFMRLEDLRNELASDPDVVDALDYRLHKDGEDYAVEINQDEKIHPE